MKTEYQNNLNTRDLIAIGVFAAISLAIFFVVGGIAAFTVVGTVANIPIVCFFTSIAYMLLVSRVRKPGTFLIMGLLNVLPGLMAANAVGVALSVFGWGIADLIASFGKYTGRKLVAIAYVVGCTLQSALYTLPMYASGGAYLIERQGILRLSDIVLETYLRCFTWPLYGSMIALTALTSFSGAMISIRILRKHFEKAGLV